MKTQEKVAAPTAAVEKRKEVMVEFIPHGSNDKLKLTIGMIKSMVAVPTKTGVKPTDQDCIKFIALCQARKLNPFEGDAFLIGYDTKDGAKFNLITAHQAFLKRAELNPEFDGMKSGVIVERDGKVIDLEGDFFLESDKVVGGWAAVHFKNRSVPMMKRLRLKRFQKPFGIWQDDPAGMICKCAEADALRSSFPTMLGGFYLKEEMKEDQAQSGVSTPIFASDKQIAEPTPPGEPVNVEEVPEPAAAISPKERIKVLCEECEIAEVDLIVMLQGIEVAGDDEVTIDDLTSESVEYVLSEWEKIEAKIKEVA